MKKSLNLSKLKSLGVFTAKEAKAAGFSQPTLSRLLKRGQLRRCRRGFYCHKDSDIPAENLDYVVATKKFGPSTVIGLWSALRYHQLTDRVPNQIWVIVPRDIKTKELLYRCVRVQTSPKIGVIDFKTFRISTVERTIVECFRFATKVGLSTAISAARSALDNRMTTPQKLMKIAKELGLEKYLVKHWESISIEQ